MEMTESQQSYLLIAIALVALFFMIRGKSVKSLLRDATEQTNLGHHSSAARAYEIAAEKSARKDSREAARLYNEAGNSWMNADRPAAALFAYRQSLDFYARGGWEPDDIHAGITENLTVAETRAAPGGPAAEQEEERRRGLSKHLDLLRRGVLFGGLIAVYLAINFFAISYWWLLAPFAASMVVHWQAEKL